MLSFFHRIFAIALGFMISALAFFRSATLLVPPKMSEGAEGIALLSIGAVMLPAMLIFAWVTSKPSPSLTHFVVAGTSSVLAGTVVMGVGLYTPVLIVIGASTGFLELGLLAGCLGGLLTWTYLVLVGQIPRRWA
jgi:hypothetical protein